MSNCILCSKELKFLNTPTFGSGKLSDGGTVCSNCFKQINNKNSKVAFKLKNYSLAEIKDLLEDKGVQSSETDLKINEIKTHIQSLNLENYSTFKNRKELDELPDILADSEVIDNIIQGMYNNGVGILVSTNKRLIFIDKRPLFGLKVEDFPLDKITSIQYETGLMFGKIKIYASGNTATIEQAEKNYCRKFAEFVRNKLLQPKENESSTNSQPDILGQIEKLAKLRDSGILSEDEFTDQKIKLLEKL